MELFIVSGETRTESHGVVHRVSDSVTISRVVLECLAAKKAANLRPSYLRNLRIYLQAFASGRENHSISTFTLRVIEEWFASRSERPATRRGGMSKLSTLFSFAWRRGYIRENPCFRLDRPRLDYKPPLIFAPLEVRTLLRYLLSNGKRKWRLPQAILGLFCGIRPAELCRLTWADIDLVKGIVRIDASASKVRHRRIVPISENAIAWLKLCKQGPDTIGSKRGKWMRAMTRKTGLKWHSDILRHTCASYMVARDENTSRISRWLGNSETILLNHYCELVSAEDSVAFWNILPLDEKLPGPSE